jgi:DNA-binding NtrC family response regulator
MRDDALAALMAYDWPRNIRELHNVIERTVLFMTATVIQPHHLSLPDSPTSPPQPAARQAPGFSIVLPDDCATLSQMEAEAIRQAYAHTNGNITRAAKLIGVARETFRRKLSNFVHFERRMQK